MADNKAPSFQKYSESGFGKSSGVAELQQQASQIKTDDVSLRQQAEAQYKPTYEAEQRSLQTQLSALIKSQTDDSELLNTQYQQSVNTMIGKLAKRGLNTGATPDATVVALDKFRNEVMTQRQAVYGGQQKALQRLSDTHKADYELNIQARMATNRSNALTSLNDLLTQIAQLQAGSYEDYTKYLLAKKKSRGGGGGGGRRSGYGSSGTTPNGVSANSGLGTGYFAGSGNSGTTHIGVVGAITGATMSQKKSGSGTAQTKPRAVNLMATK